MNWVAHFVLSEDEEELVVGNWLGEIVRAKDYEKYSKPLQRGILMHREIDTYTDANPIIKRATQLFHQAQGKFSPVVVDLVFDYFLIQNWNKYREDSYESFKKEIYKMLMDHIELYPSKLQKTTEALLHYDWFENYRTLEGIQEVLRQMSVRTKYPNQMDTAVDVVFENEEILNQYFLDFFPEMQWHCRNYLKYYDF